MEEEVGGGGEGGQVEGKSLSTPKRLPEPEPYSLTWNLTLEIEFWLYG